MENPCNVAWETHVEPPRISSISNDHLHDHPEIGTGVTHPAIHIQFKRTGLDAQRILWYSEGIIPRCSITLPQMDIADARNSRRFNVSFPCHASGIFHRHARPFSLYPPMPYSQALDHSVTDGLKKTMLLIGTPLGVTCWRNFIHSWRSWKCHSWSLCGTHLPPFY